MPPVELSAGIFWVGLNDRTTDLFEGLWPISREGVSYNSYLVKGRRTAVIDLGPAHKAEEYLSQLAGMTDLARLDYIVLNHLEPDHTGVLHLLRRLAPGAVVLGSAKCVDMLASFFDIKDNVRAVADGETLDLGPATLRFLSTPFLHWPETIMTYEVGGKTLFSCDAFGGYGAIRDSLFDEGCRHLPFYEEEALRYYVNIVAKYSSRVLEAASKLAGLEVGTIAPSHGLVWRKDPGRIISLYKKWAEAASGRAERGVTLVYGSMYGHTEAMMNAVAQGAARTGIPLDIFDAARTHGSYILPSLWLRSGVVVGAPTYEVSLFPPVAALLEMAAHKRILNKTAAYFGSYGWSGGAELGLRKIVEPLHWTLAEVFSFRGSPTQDDLKRGEQIGERLARALPES